MTSVLPASLQTPNHFPVTLHPPPNPKKSPKPSISRLSPGAAADDGKPPAPPPDAGGVEDSEFENRLSQVRIKYRSGTGKKAEQRRARKSAGGGGGGGGKKGKGIMLPPVPLREAVNVSGEKVELGFTPYSERINGRIAGLGLAAVVLVELGSGKGILNYHAPPVLFLQIYTVIALSALFIKFEKERISVWPEKSESSSASSAGTGD
ncbi:hypothetical protein KFK09_007574 [Dendrobium nobile]|uniref:Uncharacterized protein n=1 Tax=Dendrobium nobile TaxID=94219 RepID=A0A8T3BVM4_DENNO|nr:hypothetical protein KFK09_007574 [Dendrobium nobile]